MNGSIVAYLPVDETTIINWQIMGPKEIKVDVDLPGVLFCPVNSYIQIGGENYTVNTVPSVVKQSDFLYKYTITFESNIYRLYDKKLKHLNNKTFQYYGDLSDYAQLITDNINQIDTGWIVGVCDVVPEKTVNFDQHTCRTALDTVAEAFAVEWNVVGKSIQFVKQVGNDRSLIFKYGKGNGLYTLSYQYQDDMNIVTRAFGYGSTRNLPQGYRSGATQLMFDGFYLDKNVDLYKTKEGDFIDEDVYPLINGLVSSVSVFDPNSSQFSIIDATLGFNLRDYFSSDTPKISFLTGELQGQEFEIKSFDNITKTITIKVFVDGSNNALPNATFQVQAGDTYTLFDMFLPDNYVTAAETLLKSKTQEWLDENSVPRVLYSLEIDPLYARDNNIILTPGDRVTVIDDALGINSQIRISSTNYPVNFPDVINPNTKITVQIANFIPYTTTERVIADTIDNQKDIKVVDRTNSEKARLNTLNLKTLQGRIFNPDGTLYDGPESLIAGMAAFGYDSQNFNLNNVTISPNAGADPDSLIISAGELIHRIYKVGDLGYIWSITSHTWSGLDSNKFYYVYAKCSTNELIGTWEISETPVHVNDVPGYYAFNLGVLYEVNTDGYRDFEFTKGMTYIVGDQITTGRIKDLTGQNYIDLSSGEFNLGDGDSGLDWDVTTPGTLTIRGALASKIIQVGSSGMVNAGISGITDDGATSIRFWAGSDVAHKSDGKFIVYDNGNIKATAGKIGNWTIGTKGLSNTENVDAEIRQVRKFPDGNTKEASVGTGISDTYNAVGIFKNNEASGGQNIGLVAGATNGSGSGSSPLNNLAIWITDGYLYLADGIISGGGVGQSFIQVYKGSSGDNYFVEFKNGIAVRYGAGNGL